MAIKLVERLAVRYPKNSLAHNARQYAAVFRQERYGLPRYFTPRILTLHRSPFIVKGQALDS